MALIDVRVPDIGDFDEVAVIEVLVNVGDTVAVDQSLVTVESDKASMEIPSSHAGVVKAMTVKLGDKVTKGSVLLQVEAQVDAAIPAAAATAAHTTAAPEAKAAVPAAAAARAPAVAVDAPSDTDCDLLVLGGGPGGYSAAFRAADLGLKVILVAFA